MRYVTRTEAEDSAAPADLKTCRLCTVQHPLEMFFRDRTKPDGRRPRCKPCDALQAKRYREENVEKVRASIANWAKRNPHVARETTARYRAKNRTVGRKTHLSRYGITIEEYERLAELQDNLCAICGCPETRKNPHTGQARHLSVDHDHKTGKVRALLCSPCNSALGHLRDDADRALAALIYLEEHSSSGM